MKTWFSANLSMAKRAAWMLLLSGATCVLWGSTCGAQGESPFAIRVETPEVVVPVVVVDRSHFRMTSRTSYEELDEEITDLAVRDFRVFEDGVEQPIDSISLELPRIRDVRDNVSHHIEYSFTPRGTWASPDLGTPPEGGPSLSLLPTYLVSYAPPASSAGSCHRIRIKVMRHHVTVYARDEYCNTKHPITDPVGGTKLGKWMEEHADSNEAGEFPLAVQVGSFVGNSDGRRVDIAVEFPWSALKRKWVRVNLYSVAAIMGIVYDESGSVVARFSDMTSSMPWNVYRGPLPADPNFLRCWERAEIPTRYETQMELPPGVYRLQVMVTDGEKIGRLEVPVNVRRYRADRLEVGDIFFCRRYAEAPEGAQAAARAPKYVPLVANGVEFAPAGSLRFGGDQALVSYFEIYESPEKSGSASFQLRIADGKTGELRMETGWQPVEAEARLKNRAIPIAAKMGIEALSPGEYEMEVKVRDSTGVVTSRQTRKFVVE